MRETHNREIFNREFPASAPRQEKKESDFYIERAEVEKEICELLAQKYELLKDSSRTEDFHEKAKELKELINRGIGRKISAEDYFFHRDQTPEQIVEELKKQRDELKIEVASMQR